MTQPSHAPAQRRHPPGPGGHPLLGILPEIRRDPLGFNLRITRQYGDILRARIALWPTYQVNHPDHVRHVLQANHRNYSKRTFGFSVTRWLLGKGLATSEGAFWLRQRRLMQPAFHQQRIAAFGELMTRTAREALEGWWWHAERGQPLDVQLEMTRLTLRVATRALFSLDVGPEVDRIERCNQVILRFLQERFYTPLIPTWLPTPANRRAGAARRSLEEIVRRIIEERRGSDRQPDDLLGLLLSVRDEETGRPMDEAQIRDEVMTLLLAGHETTANTLAWACYLLARHPEVERRLVAELGRVLDGRAPTVDDLSELPFLQQVVEETLRLYPPVWGFSRRSLAEDEIGGYYVPPDTEVWICTYTVHRHPKVWSDPEAFRPERFAERPLKDRPRLAWLPFGGGPRMCIGAGFAMLEAQLVLATLLPRFHLSLVRGHPVVPEPLFSLRMRHGLRVTVRPRRPLAS